MAMQSIGGPIRFPTPVNTTNPNISSQAIDAASEVAAVVFRPKNTKTCTHVHFRTATVTTGATVDVRLETVDGSGQPSSTLYGTNTNASQAIADGDDNTWFRVALTASASVVAGTPIAIVIAGPVSPGNLNVATFTPEAIPSRGFPIAIGPTRSTKIDQGPHMIGALEYNDGSFEIPEAVVPAHVSTTSTIDTSTNPDEVAMIFTPQVKMRVVGWWAILGLAAAADVRINLYQSGNNTPLLTKDFDGDFTTSVGGFRGVEDNFGDTEELAAGTTYYLGFVPLSLNDVTVKYFEVHASHLGLLDCLAGKQALHWAQRNRSSTSDPDSAAWTATTNRRLFAGVLVDQFDDGAGSGSGMLVHPGLVGGIRG